MIRVSKIGSILFVHIRRHDTMAPIMLRVGSDEIASLRQTQLRLNRHYN